MATDDRYQIDLECPSCGRKGTAEITENDGRSFINSPRRDVAKVSEGFTVSGQNMRRRFHCDCGGVYKPFDTLFGHQIGDI